MDTSALVELAQLVLDCCLLPAAVQWRPSSPVVSQRRQHRRCSCFGGQSLLCVSTPLNTQWLPKTPRKSQRRSLSSGPLTRTISVPPFILRHLTRLTSASPACCRPPARRAACCCRQRLSSPPPRCASTGSCFARPAPTRATRVAGRAGGLRLPPPLPGAFRCRSCCHASLPSAPQPVHTYITVFPSFALQPVPAGQGAGPAAPAPAAAAP